ncbi:MAG: hypothetical protein PVJ27_02335 [Candidatus Brocadiaceae bacterium]|jgi:flagellar export protein FliJ
MAQDGFDFRYQKILDFKQHQEKALELELARLDTAVLAQRQSRRRWDMTRRQVLDQMGGARREGDLAHAAQCADYLRHVRRQMKNCDERLDELQRERERVRRELEKIMRSRKAVENYRDRMKKLFMVEREKAEQKVVDLHAARKFIEAEEGS